MTTTQTFSDLFAAWMRRQGFKTAKEAAPAFGCAVSSAYSYATGQSLPPSTRIPAIARTLGIPERRLRKVIEHDRKAKESAHV